MSRNFEVLLRAGKEEAELLRQTDIVEAFPHIETRHVPRHPKHSEIHIDRAVREEETKLVQRVFLLSGREAPQVVVFSGVQEDNGAAGICARAAAHLADETGSRVCLVEGDLKSPRLHDYFGTDNLSGLTDALSESGPICNFMQHLPGGNVSLLSAGFHGGEERIPWKSEAWRLRVTELRKEFKFTLIAGPPANLDADPVLLGQSTDGVILVLESNITRREIARKIKESLAAAHVKLLGAVLNNRTFPIPEVIYRKL
jgi:Mrp family chromosome partitioning ATPase